jgi:hypothetical protein
MTAQIAPIDSVVTDEFTGTLPWSKVVALLYRYHEKPWAFPFNNHSMQGTWWSHPSMFATGIIILSKALTRPQGWRKRRKVLSRPSPLSAMMDYFKYQSFWLLRKSVLACVLFDNVKVVSQTVATWNGVDSVVLWQYQIGSYSGIPSLSLRWLLLGLTG